MENHEILHVPYYDQKNLYTGVQVYNHDNLWHVYGIVRGHRHDFLLSRHVQYIVDDSDPHPVYCRLIDVTLGVHV